MINRTKILFMSLIAVFICLSILGAVTRASYADIQNEDNFIERYDFGVAAVSEDLADQWVGILRDEADNPERIVMKVTAVEAVSYGFLSAMQKVKVQKIFQKGNSTLKTGDLCYVSRGGNCLMYNVKLHNDYFLNTGFVNAMKVGEDYLIIMETQMEKLDPKEIPVLFTDCIVFPVFAYKDSASHQINPVLEQDTLWVCYKGLEENEFFALSEEVYGKLMDMKHSVLEKFPDSAK